MSAWNGSSASGAIADAACRMPQTWPRWGSTSLTSRWSPPHCKLLCPRAQSRTGMRSFLTILIVRLVATAVLIAVGVEGGYRLYQFFKQPDYFSTTEIDAAGVSV